MADAPKIVKDLAEHMGGTVEKCERLPDGSGFAVVSMPLPANHWSNGERPLAPPMPFRMGDGDPRRRDFAEKIREAGKYAYLATGIGEEDHDPDAFLQNLVVGLLGYWSPDGLASDDFANPKPPPEMFR